MANVCPQARGLGEAEVEGNPVEGATGFPSLWRPGSARGHCSRGAVG